MTAAAALGPLGRKARTAVEGGKPADEILVHSGGVKNSATTPMSTMAVR